MARRRTKTLLPSPADKAAAAVSQPRRTAARYLFAGLAMLLLFAAFSREVADSDFWWHLRTGQYVVQTHRLPYPDPFAYTTASAGSAYPGEELVRKFNLTHEWLFQAILYLIFAGTGFAGVVVFRALTLMALCGFVRLIVYRRTGGYYRSVLAAIATGSVCVSYLSDRPFILSFLLLAVTLAIVESRRVVWLLPAIFLFWANAHGGFILGWVVLGAYCGEAVVAKIRGKAQAGDNVLLVSAGLSVAASALNPNVFDAIRVISLYSHSVMQSRVWEWQRPSLWPITPFSAIFVIAMGAMLWANRRARLADWLLYLAFAGASLMAVRNTMLIGILGPVLIASYLPWKRAVPEAAQWGAVVLLLLATGGVVAQGNGLRFGATEWKYPWGGAKFIEDHGIRGHLFNDYTDGGFLIWRLWPLQRVFIDGRALSDQLYEDFANIATNIGNAPGRNAAELIRHYGIEVVMLGGFEYNAGTLYLTVPAMSDVNQTEWKLVYLDDTVSIFMRRPPAGVEAIRLPYALAGAERQCRNHIAHDPSMPLCAKTLAYQFLGINDLTHARAWFAYYLDHMVSYDAQADATYRGLISRRGR